MHKEWRYSYPPGSSHRKGFLKDLQDGQSGLNIHEAHITMKFLKPNCRLSAIANDNPPGLMSQVINDTVNYAIERHTQRRL